MGVFMTLRQITVIFALIFFVLGSMWLYSIYKRGEGSWPKGWNYFKLMGESFSSGKLAKDKIQAKENSTLRNLPRSIHKNYVRYFWVIVVMELMAAMLYVISAVALLRLYPIGRLLVLWTLLWELWLKIAVIVYEKSISLPIAQMFGTKNIVYSYFSPTDRWTSGVSLYMSGLDFLSSEGPIFLIYYFLFLIFTFLLFSRESLIKTFGR